LPKGQFTIDQGANGIYMGVYRFDAIVETVYDFYAAKILCAHQSSELSRGSVTKLIGIHDQSLD
jgi:hypothetical protein